MGTVLAAVLVGLLRFLRSLRGAAARIFLRLLRARAGKPRENRRKTQETLPALSAEAAARSADARLQSRVRARCLDALAVPLAVVFALLGASSPSPLAVFAAIFALLFRSPCLRLSLRTRFPFHDSQVCFSMKSRSKFLPGRPRKFQDFFFSAPGGSQERSGSDLGAIFELPKGVLACILFWEPF